MVVNNDRTRKLGRRSDRRNAADRLERFSLRLTQFNLRILQSPLGFNRIRDGYSGSNLVKNALSEGRREFKTTVFGWVHLMILLCLDCDIAFPSPTLAKVGDGAAHGA